MVALRPSVVLLHLGPAHHPRDHPHPRPERPKQSSRRQIDRHARRRELQDRVDEEEEREEEVREHHSVEEARDKVEVGVVVVLVRGVVDQTTLLVLAVLDRPHALVLPVARLLVLEVLAAKLLLDQVFAVVLEPLAEHRPREHPLEVRPQLVRRREDPAPDEHVDQDRPLELLDDVDGEAGVVLRRGAGDAEELDLIDPEGDEEDEDADEEEDGHAGGVHEAREHGVEQHAVARREQEVGPEVRVVQLRLQHGALGRERERHLEHHLEHQRHDGHDHVDDDRRHDLDPDQEVPARVEVLELASQDRKLVRHVLAHHRDVAVHDHRHQRRVDELPDEDRERHRRLLVVERVMPLEDCEQLRCRLHHSVEQHHNHNRCPLQADKGEERLSLRRAEGLVVIGPERRTVE
mmetsp:Transcript_37582/g.88821  ORF Transcript_37582/g.88821 Transcript_37582/m.88821 type:complete len:406 (+) Transcript_37582:489-1706(+)